MDTLRSRIRRHLRCIDSRDLTVPGVLVLVCSLPVGAVLGATGEMDADTFLLVLLSGSLPWGLYLLLDHLLSKGHAEATGNSPHHAFYGSVGRAKSDADFETRISPRLWSFHEGSPDSDLQRGDHAQELLDKMARCRGLHQPFCHHGL